MLAKSSRLWDDGLVVIFATACQNLLKTTTQLLVEYCSDFSLVIGYRSYAILPKFDISYREYESDEKLMPD